MPDINLTIGSDPKQLFKDQKKVNKALDQQRKRTERLDRRLSRRRARNRLKDIKARIRAEKAAIREIERAERAAARKRARLIKRTAIGVGAVGLAGGAFAITQGRNILEFQERLARISVQAKKTREEQFALGESITDASVKYGVARDVLLTAFERIVDKSGEFDLARDNIDKIAKTIRGTGADAGELGELIAALASSFKNLGKGKTFEFLDILIAQGDEATINLSELTSEAEKLLGAFVTAGFKTKKQFTEFGALLQIAGKGGGKAEAATFVAQFVDQLKKRAPLIQKALGVSVTKAGGGLRDLGEIIPQLLKATDGDLGKIAKIIPSIRGAKPLELLAIEYQNLNGELREFNRLVELGDEAQEVNQERFKRVSETSGQAFKRLSSLGVALSDKALVGAIDQIANSIERILADPAKLKQLEDTFVAIGRAAANIAKFGGGVARFIGGIGKPLTRGTEERRSLRQRFRDLTTEQQSRLREQFPRALAPIASAKQQAGLAEAIEKLEFQLNVTNNANGTTDAQLTAQVNGDTGSKRIIANRRKK